MITIYALGYGGLLLVGGRLSDLVGRRRGLMIGLTGFGLASALGGAAVDPAMLFTARALQGVFGALLTPSVLASLGAAGFLCLAALAVFLRTGRSGSARQRAEV